MKNLKLFFALFAMLALGVGNAWGAALGSGYEKVTDISTLSAGDRVVLYADDISKGVTGWDSNKDATVAESGWVEYLVEGATGGVYLKDENANKYIASPGSSNVFKYGTKAVCSVNASGVIACNSRYLYQNGTNYRMYADKSSDSNYKPFYVYKVVNSTPKQKYTLTYQAGSVTGSLEVEEGANLLDALKDITPVACDPTSTELIGWSESEITTKQANSPTLLTDADVMPSKAHSVYYVFAKKETTGGGAATDITIDLSKKDQITTNTTSSLVFTVGDVTFTNTKVSGSTSANNYCPGTTGKTYNSTRTYNGHQVTIASANTISKIVITAGTNAYATAIQSATWTNATASASNTTVTITPNAGVTSVSFKPSATAGMTKVVVTTGGGTTTYSDYITTCSGSTEPVLSSIKISGDLENKTYEEGDELDLTGLTVQANYESGDPKDVTNDVEWSYEPLTAGQTSVTVTATYEDKTATQPINGLTVNEHIVTPGEKCTGTLGYAFWGLTAEKLTATANEINYTKEFDDVTVNIKNGSKANAYFKADHTRVYSGGYTMTFSVPDGYIITDIAFTASGDNWEGTHTANVGTMSDNKNWTGANQNVTITFDGSCRIASICVTYKADVKYALTITEPTEGGTLVVKDGENTLTSGAEIYEGTKLTVTATPANGYEGGTVVVKDAVGNDVTATVYADGVLTMPAYAVTISATFEEKPCELLAKPTVSATTTYSSATLTWETVANAAKYSVKVGTADAVETTETSYDITGLTAETTYTYQVQAIAEADQDTYCDSEVAEGTFTTATAPTATLYLTDIEGTTTLTGSLNGTITLPTEAAECSNTFVGWDADKNCNHTPTYAKGAYFELTVAEDTLYAVYASGTTGETVTIKHNVPTTGTSTNMTGQNDAETFFGLDNDEWSILSAKNGAQNHIGVNKDGTLRLYYHADGGSTLTITAPKDVASIVLNCNSSYKNAWVKVDGNLVSPIDGVYSINAKTFVIGNANTENKQVYVQSIEVTLAGVFSNYSTTCVAAPTTYKVTIADDIQNGSVTASHTSAEEGATITLTVTPEDSYVLDALTVTDASSNTIEVDDNKFTMPASDVTVSATFKQDESGEVESNSTATIVFASNANQEDGSSLEITEQTDIDEVVAQGVEFISGFADVKKVYPNSVHGLKLGTGSAIGKITIGLNISKKVSKITFKTYQYKEKEATIKFSAGGKEGSTSEFGDYTLTFDEPTTVSQIVISTEQASKGRAYVSQIDIELAEDEAGEGGEDPVVPTPTVNPTATFIFNTADGLAKLGITYPNTDDGASKKTDIENNTTVISNGVGLTMTGGTTTATRVWLTAGGVLDLRVYKGATLTFAVADGFEIIKVDFEGSELTNLAVDETPMTGTIWEGNQKSVTFKNIGSGVKINTIAVTVAYTRDVTPGEYGTICLPYAVNNYTGATFYAVAGKEGNKIVFDEVTELEAGKPYIFMAEAAEIKLAQVGEAAIEAGYHNSLQGTFNQIDPAEDNILVGNYMVVNNIIKKCGINCGLKANRAYFDGSELGKLGKPGAQMPGRKRITMGTESENAATGTEDVVAPAGQTLKIIENGQLIIIRGGEKFNAQGMRF